MKLGPMLLLLLLSLGIQAQEIAPGVYWIYFTDKAGSAYQIDEPEHFLSERSINRRAMQGLAVDHHDIPVTTAYLQEIEGMGIEIRHVSRWLNGIAMVHMTKDRMEKLVMPVPPLEEQHRIVAKVDELMALCDQLEQQQTDSLQAHQTLVKTVLDAFVRPTARDDVKDAQVSREARMPGATGGA